MFASAVVQAIPELLLYPWPLHGPELPTYFPLNSSLAVGVLAVLVRGRCFCDQFRLDSAARLLCAGCGLGEGQAALIYAKW